jgi:glyoxylase-like metal-dependent hydrolase (beta-lactamase superfamily II)
MKIIPVDCNYVEEGFASAYLMVHEGPQGWRGFFVECNTNHAIPFLKEAALREGLSPLQIDGLVITHVHLDHAGGAGLFLQEFPNAKLYAHPRAARHAIDPSKLIASATQVYGEAFMKECYGTILPCPSDRVVILEDGDEIDWSSAAVKLPTKHLRGHANHHLVVIEPTSRTLFSGDSFGVSYPRINQHQGILALPSTSPTDFDGEAALSSIDWILSLNLNRVGLTHFGFLIGAEITIAGMQLKDYLKHSIELLARIRQDSTMNEEKVFQELVAWVKDYFLKRKLMLDSKDLEFLKIDLKVNAQGLIHAASRSESLKVKG